MARYIDADKMIDGYNTTFPYNLDYCDDGDLFEWVESQPTADVAEVRHGEWIPKKHKMYDFIKHKNIMVVDEFRCSVCENSMHNKFRYCPHCGARMDGDEDDL